MSESVAEILLTLLTVIVCMMLLGFALTAIASIFGESSTPGIIDTFVKGMASRFVKIV